MFSPNVTSLLPRTLVCRFQIKMFQEIYSHVVSSIVHFSPATCYITFATALSSMDFSFTSIKDLEKLTEYKHLSSVIVDQFWLLFSWLETAIQISEIVCWLQATVYATDCTDGLSRCVRSGLSGGTSFLWLCARMFWPFFISCAPAWTELAQ